jgi:3-deoxy-D-manno-octulosonate 8-phosphate phosphatase (KDO 8-P phosphatase)
MNILSLFKDITTFVFDMDGVLTDGSLFVLGEGKMVRRMNIKDGYALQLAIKKDYSIIILSGGHSPEAAERLQKLGITHIYMRIENKAEGLRQFISDKNILPNQILCMGDDVPDYDYLQLADLPCCPADAVQEIKTIAKYISPYKGGEGCVRDVIEKVLKLRGHWNLDTSVKAQ